MRHHDISYSQRGWELTISDGPRWTHVLFWLTESALTAVGHPCCGHGIGRFRFPLIGDLCRHVLGRVANIDHRARRPVVAFVLTVEQVRSLGTQVG